MEATANNMDTPLRSEVIDATVLDLENGEDKEEEPERVLTERERSQLVFIRHESDCNAMGAAQRLRTRVQHIVRKVCCMGAPSKKHDGEVAPGKKEGQDGRLQFRVEATRHTKKKWYSRLCCGLGAKREHAVALGVSPNQRLARYLHWLFRINFFFLFAICCFMFFTLCFLFAALILIAGSIDETCVKIGGNDFNSNGTPFADAFALSWTTFSTVGYGSTYPALSPETSSKSDCVFITAICSFESFIGVLYSGFCGAILFGKVLRIQSHAQVLFSDPVVIRYGSGVEDSGADDEDEEDDGVHHIPCPVLEFRIINRLYKEVGGEIMDATLNVVASVDANDVDPSVRDAVDPERQRYLRNLSAGGSNGRDSTVSSEGGSESGHDTVSERSFSSYRNFSKSMMDPIASLRKNKKDHQTVDEDPSSRLVNKRVFSKMLIEASDHPFFKRVWVARHILDDHSPILTPRARKAIRKNHGFWPEHLNSYEGVKDSLQFHQILVSLNGVSNLSAADVYAQKIYDAVDINVGYQFVNLLYRDVDGSLKIDTDLINDVREQNGGGGEPLFFEE